MYARNDARTRTHTHARARAYRVFECYGACKADLPEHGRPCLHHEYATIMQKARKKEAVWHWGVYM